MIGATAILPYATENIDDCVFWSQQKNIVISIRIGHTATAGLQIRFKSIDVKKDFAVCGGVEGFLRRYRDDLPARITVRASIDYDWAVNATE